MQVRLVQAQQKREHWQCGSPNDQERTEGAEQRVTGELVLALVEVKVGGAGRGARTWGLKNRGEPRGASEVERTAAKPAASVTLDNAHYVARRERA